MSNKVTICHWTGSGDYKVVTANKNGILNGHNPSQGIHHGDIIPPFDGFPGHNWDEEGIAIWEAHCTVPVVEEPEVPVDPKPEPEFDWIEGEPVLDCETGEVSIELTEVSAGYYLGDDNEWHLGEFFPTGNTDTQVILGGETCEAPGIPDLECSEGHVPGWLDEDGLPTSCVRDFIPAEEAPLVVPETVIETTTATLTEPTPPAKIDTGITADPSIGVFAVVMGAAAIAALVRRVWR